MPRQFHPAMRLRPSPPVIMSDLDGECPGAGVDLGKSKFMLIGARRDEPSGASLWPAALFVWGPGDVSSSHSHHSVQLILALRGSLRVRPRRGSRWRNCSGVLFAPGAVHVIDGRCSPVM